MFRVLSLTSMPAPKIIWPQISSRGLRLIVVIRFFATHTIDSYFDRRNVRLDLSIWCDDNLRYLQATGSPHLNCLYFYHSLSLFPLSLIIKLIYRSIISSAFEHNFHIVRELRNNLFLMLSHINYRPLVASIINIIESTNPQNVY